MPPKRKWNGSEILALVKGVSRYGKVWSLILIDPEFSQTLQRRNGPKIRHKWGQLEDAQQDLGEGVLCEHLQNITVDPQYPIVVGITVKGEGELANWTEEDTATLRLAVDQFGEVNNPWGYIILDENFRDAFEGRGSHHLQQMWYMIKEYDVACLAARWLQWMKDAAVALRQQLFAGVNPGPDLMIGGPVGNPEVPIRQEPMELNQEEGTEVQVIVGDNHGANPCKRIGVDEHGPVELNQQESPQVIVGHLLVINPETPIEHEPAEVNQEESPKLQVDSKSRPNKRCKLMIHDDEDL